MSDTFLVCKSTPWKKNHSWYLSAPARQGKCFNQMNMDTEASGFDQDRVRVTDWWRKKTKSIQTSKNCGDNSDTCSGPKCFSSAFERFQSRYYWNFWVYVIEMIQDWSLLNCQVHEVVHDFFTCCALQVEGFESIASGSAAAKWWLSAKLCRVLESQGKCEDCQYNAKYNTCGCFQK